MHKLDTGLKKLLNARPSINGHEKACPSNFSPGTFSVKTFGLVSRTLSILYASLFFMVGFSFYPSTLIKDESRGLLPHYGGTGAANVYPN
ncbi:MAG: hypothetical protein HN366_00570 [Deltaproteobacteria bacterium]|nr:hypothetical protein [Deltaproteobacteria bacterium]